MNKKLFEDIGKRVKKRRIELGYTQEYLAEKMDVSIQMISGTESGKKALKLENFIKFCEILETTPDYLIKGRRFRRSGKSWKYRSRNSFRNGWKKRKVS